MQRLMYVQTEPRMVLVIAVILFGSSWAVACARGPVPVAAESTTSSTSPATTKTTGEHVSQSQAASSPPSPTPDAIGDPAALALCQSGLPGAVLAEFDTVFDINSWGPRPTSRSSWWFAEYPDEHRVAICLVPAGSESADIFGIPEGSEDPPVHVWTQSGMPDAGSAFYPPV